ncbi:MAG: type II toxin-antitoxin system VapC family toxin [Gemmatimonadota bacterium]
MRKYVLDTNLYVQAFRNADAAGELEEYYAAMGPVTFLSSLVLHELLAGSSSSAKAKEIRDELVGPLVRAGRVITPSHRAWDQAGEALARMARGEPRELRTVPKSLVNDFLLAASCRESGVTLVTDNAADFDLIQKYVKHSHRTPWPKR